MIAASSIFEPVAARPTAPPHLHRRACAPGARVPVEASRLDTNPSGTFGTRAPARITSHKSRLTTHESRPTKCHTMQSKISRKPLKTNENDTRRVTHFFDPLGSPRLSRACRRISRLACLAPFSRTTAPTGNHRSPIAEEHRIPQKKWDTVPLLFTPSH